MVENDLEELGRSFAASPDTIAFKAFDVAKLPKRIYPNYFAPVITIFQSGSERKRVILPMRYSVYNPSSASPGGPTPFNARRDHLSSPFWSKAFSTHRGIVIAKSFFEWVNVEGLIKSKIVTLDEVKKQFFKESEQRKNRLEAQGKKYVPTKTELKDPLKRDIIIHFKPTKESMLIMPVIYTEHKNKEGILERGFAIITDEPPPEIIRAGHNRCPIVLKNDFIDQWLDPVGQDISFLTDLLSHRPDEEYIFSILNQVI